MLILFQYSFQCILTTLRLSHGVSVVAPPFIGSVLAATIGEGLGMMGCQSR